MLRRALMASWICVQAASVASAQVGSVDVEVSSAFSTKYIWNGFDRIESRGLDNGPVVQPRVDVTVEGSPLHAYVRGSFVMNGAERAARNALRRLRGAPHQPPGQRLAGLQLLR